jgi:hypothetical protein
MKWALETQSSKWDCAKKKPNAHGFKQREARKSTILTTANRVKTGKYLVVVLLKKIDKTKSLRKLKLQRKRRV